MDREEFKESLEGALKFFPGFLFSLSPFFASLFPLFPQKRLILRLRKEVRFVANCTSVHRARFPP